MHAATYLTRSLILFILYALALVPVLAFAQEFNPDGTPPRPNILLIVADDLGYADLGVHGSDIRTPNIDQLAKTGVLFTQFHTAPMCAPTRSMLLSGNNNHVAGMGRQHPSEAVKEKIPGYEGHLSNRVAPFPGLLQAAGYHTYQVGKWHLGTEAEHSPKAAGFERSFGLVDGAATHFDGRGFENTPSIYREDGQLTEWPSGQYSTAVYTDKLLQYLQQDRADEQPFFAMAAYTSPHWPLQVPPEELDRYAGVFDSGYDALREKNFSALQAAGIVPGDSALPPRNEAIQPWNELTAEQQRRESRKMELYAAMVVSGYGVIGAGRRSNAYVTVMDLAPSFIALAGATYPQGVSVQAMRGSSMLPLLQNRAEAVHDDEEVTVLSHRGQALVRQGPWKLTAVEPVFNETHFALYNLNTDPGETTDLSGAEPEKHATMIEIWRQQRLELGIILPQDL